MNIIQKTVFEFLTKFYKSNISKKLQRYKIIDDKKFVYLPVETLQNEFELSAFKQRNLLGFYEEADLIEVRLGQARSRYFRIKEKAQQIEILKYKLEQYDKCFDEILSICKGNKCLCSKFLEISEKIKEAKADK